MTYTNIKELCALPRVSRATQFLQAQEFTISQAFPAANIHWFKELGVSGKTPNHKRPQLLAATKLAIKKKIPLVVPNISRLGRDLAELTTWYRDYVMSNKIKLIALDQPNLEPETAGLFFTFQQTERIKISQRTRAALQGKLEEIKSKGFFISKAGKKIKRLGNITKASGLKGAATNKKDADKNAEKYLPLIQQLRQQGLTIKQVAADLNAKQIPTVRKHGSWHTSTVMNILRRVA